MYLDDFVEWLLAAAMVMIFAWLIAIGAAAIISLHENARSQEVFMELCKQEKKEYECMALWKGGIK